MTTNTLPGADVDRRRHTRHRLRGSAQVGDYQGIIEDLSISGGAAVVDGAPVIGRNYECIISASYAGADVDLAVRGIVRNCVRQSGTHMHRVGIEWDDIGDAELWRLIDYVSMTTS